MMADICFTLKCNGAKTHGSFSESAYGISACIHYFCGKWIPPPAYLKIA